MTAPAVPKFLAPSKISISYQSAVALTPTDNTAIGPFAALYVGVSGDVTVILRSGDGAGGVTPVTFKSVPVGILPVAVQSLQATGTTATNLVGLA